MPGLSVIIPASNEEALIGRCLEAVLASDPKPGAGSGSIALPMPLEVVVVANGCRDGTADVARGYARAFRAMGWDFKVLEMAGAGKLAALGAGDKASKFGARAYLDADVEISPPLLDQVGRALQVRRAAYVGGRVRIVAPDNMVSRHYARLYQRVPFMTTGVPGCGFFAVNEAGRRRWRGWPDIISDDTFVRLLFSPAERIGVAASYDWPIVAGWDNLVRVRARQDAGVRQLRRKFPQLIKNDDKPRLGLPGKLGLLLRDPAGFAVYSAVALAVRLRRRRGGGEDGWSRGR